MANLKGKKIARVASVPMFFATHLKFQLQAIEREGAVVTVITSQGAELEQIPWSQGLRFQGVEIPRSISPVADLKALVKLYAFFKRSDFSIVHSTTPKAGLLCAISAWLARVPIRLHTFTGQPWVTLTGLKALIAKTADRVIGLLSTHCYADSPSQRDFLVQQKIVARSKISVMGIGSIAGVNIERFDANRFSKKGRTDLRKKLDLKENDFVILFLGRICEDKGILELLAAMETLKAEGVAARLLLVGPIEPLSKENPTIIRETLIASGAQHVDYTTTPEDYLSIANCLCLPSYREGFGGVVVEAASMGVPCVGSDIYGLSDAIVDGETGLLVPARQIAPLAAALKSMVSTPDQVNRMGQAAKVRAREQFSSHHVSGAVISEYIRLLK